jgi:FkbM family methyltransferase
MTPKSMLRNTAIYLAGSAASQALLSRMAQKINYLRGIGAGAYVDSSGEIALVAKIFRENTQGRPLTVFDVGANSGQFSALLSDGLPVNSSVHCFEPSSSAFSELAGRFADDARFVLNCVGLSSTRGEAVLHCDKPGSGLASLHVRDLENKPDLAQTESEPILLETLDNYCTAHRIQRIDLLKIDTEGHELEVLNGASAMLRSGAIGLVSFEFGGCNIDSRTYLRDFVRFFQKYNRATMSRITPSGFLAPLGPYDELSEQFGVTNYVVALSTT